MLMRPILIKMIRKKSQFAPDLKAELYFKDSRWLFLDGLCNPIQPIPLITRMHSSRMCATCSSSRLIGGGSASVHARIPPRCGPGDRPSLGSGDSPGVGLETPLGVGLETPRCGPGDPPGCRPGDPQVWAWRPPRPDPSTSPLGVGLETLQTRPLNFPPGCGPADPQDQTPQLPLWVWAWRFAMHAGIPPPNHPPPSREQND